jgi:hypothetical protein
MLGLVRARRKLPRVVLIGAGFGHLDGRDALLDEAQRLILLARSKSAIAR